MKNYQKYIIGIAAILGVLAVSYFAGRYSANKSNKTNLSNIIALRDSVKTYQVEIGGLKVNVYEQGQVVLSQKEAIKTGLVEKEALRKLNMKTLSELTSLKLQINIVRDSVSNNGQVVYIDTNKTKPAILLPFTFADKNKYFALTGGYDLTGRMNYNFNIAPLSLAVYGGIDKKGVAKLSVVTDNPYIKISEISSTKISVDKPSRISIGATIGYGAMYVDKQIKFGPSAVAGVSFKF